MFLRRTNKAKSLNTIRPRLEKLEGREMFNGDPTVLDPNETAWASIRNYSSQGFAEHFNEMKDDYILTDIEVDVVGGNDRVGGVWQYNSDNRGWAEKRNLTSDQFHDEWTKYRDQGYRLIDQESYVLSGNRYYAGIWIENREDYGWVSYRNVTSAEFAERFDQYKSDYVMVDFEAYKVGNSTRYAAAWVENVDDLNWIERRGLTSEQFSDYFQQYKNDYRVTDIESYQLNGQQRYAAIWVENTNDRGWIEVRDMTAESYRNRWLRYRDLGYRLTDYEVYDHGNSQRYAGVWRQNTDRPDWDLRSDVNQLVQQHVDQFDVPGLSVAITQGGEIKYMRGFGQQDVADNTWYSARTVNRLASVAKSLSGVITVGMQEDGLIDLDNVTESLVPEMPNHHDHTLRQLLANRSGVGHYSDHGSSNQQYDSAIDAADFFWDDALVYEPGTACKYSTHGHTILGAALESVTGDSISEIIVDRLSDPYKLNSLRVEDRSEGNSFRSTLYNTDNSEANPDNISWKVLGGGLEASAYDLGRFSQALLNGQILSEQSLDEMLTVPSPTSCVDPAHSSHSNYALGWRTGTQQGTQWVGKGGNQLGANTYIRLYPQIDIGIVVLSNRNGGGHSASTVARDIGELMLNNEADKGDVNNDGQVDANDIDALNSVLGRGPFIRGYDYDVNNDGQTNIADRNYLVDAVLGTSYGDADLNGYVGFSDFLSLSENFGQAGGWAEGDTNGDGMVNFADFLKLADQFGANKKWESTSRIIPGGILKPVPSIVPKFEVSRDFVLDLDLEDHEKEDRSRLVDDVFARLPVKENGQFRI